MHGEVMAYTMVGGEEFRQDSRQQFDLTGRANEVVVDVSRWVDIVFDALEEERMLADLSQLHELVAKTLHTTGFSTEGVSRYFI